MQRIFWIVVIACCLPGCQANVQQPQAPTKSVARESWLEPVVEDWGVTALLNVGDRTEQSDYRMAGIPDGLGAFDNADGTFTLLMNHEIRPENGKPRMHGKRGAFVSRWIIETESLQVKHGEDLIQRTEPRGLTLNRLCSADLPPKSAFYDQVSGKGFDGRLFLNGEEDKSGGRAFAHTLEGISHELLDLGHIAWENVLAHPDTGSKTLVIGLDDTQNGLVLVYLGEKQDSGNPVEQAGLTGGKLYAIKAENKRFSLIALGKAQDFDGKKLRTRAAELGATLWERPEDGAWDTIDSKSFYFATTDEIGGDSRLYKLTFDDPAMPESGGKFEIVLKAQDIGAEMFDNLAVDQDGRLLIQEDPGNHPRLAAIWLHDPRSGATAKVAQSVAKHFTVGNSAFMTLDEEHSGIIEITPLLANASWFDPKRRYYLGTTQAHLTHEDEALVEYGQLWLLSGPCEACPGK